jgi:hypothetical protein
VIEDKDTFTNLMQMLHLYNEIPQKELIQQILTHPQRLFYDSLLATCKSNTSAVYITLVKEMNNLETDPAQLIGQLTTAMPKQKWLWEEYTNPSKVEGLSIDAFKQLNSLLLGQKSHIQAKLLIKSASKFTDLIGKLLKQSHGRQAQNDTKKEE